MDQIFFSYYVSSYCRGFGDEDQHPANAVEEPVAIRQDEEASSATHSKGNVSGSSKTWVA
jgi:hypothetical protein